MKKFLNKIDYRPEIDFLRAISVSAVIIYHSQINIFGYKFLQGGYLGVDIFFVISGYLITSIIFKELKNKKTFSYSNFYLKRARRILPALFIIILSCLPFSYLYLMPTSLIDFARSILFSLGFSSNFYFYFTGLEYGAVSGLLKPLLHTWSLGVEEQFYILFPLIFVSGFFLFKKNLKNYILVMFFFSLFFSELFSNKNPNLNFYFPVSRFWELLAGSLIVFYEENRKLKVSNNLSNLMCFLGLMLIILSFFYFFEPIPNPNLKSLLPIMGVTLIILFAKKGSFLTKIFSIKPFVGIGLISYSLYLWHYPIFAFARNLRIAQSSLGYLVIAILIFLLSFISYKFIEKPFRDKNFINDKNFIKIILIFLFSFLFFSWVVIFNKGFEKRFPNYNKFNTDYKFYLKQLRLTKYELGNPQFENDSKINVLIIGNSHGRDTFNSLKLNENLFSKFEFSILDTQINCIEKIIEKFEFCNKKMTRLERKIFQDSDIILISTHYNNDDIKILKTIINKLKNINKKIVLTTQIPNYYFKNYFSLVDEFFYEKNRLPNTEEKIALEERYYQTLKPDIQNFNQELAKISKSENINLLNKKELFCDEKNKRCIFLTDNNRKIYYDNYHLTINGAIFIGKKIFETGWLRLN